MSEVQGAGKVARFSAATLVESGAIALPPRIRPLETTWRIAGRAFTVDLAGGHNIWLHHAVAAATPGDVLVAAVAGDPDFGYWGEILATAARVRGLAGLVIDGCVRDRDELVEIGFPVFARGLCIRGTGKDTSVGGLGRPVTLGDVTVRPGDLVVGDADGLVVAAADALDGIAARAADRVSAEAAILDRIAGGESTVDIYGFARVAAPRVGA
ncbi:RraA family protein [Pseudonocardia dioxanivorans]|uniref:RraA family protein n=1 Tax=Pseudonocardia dioxanivorans TaxID=240495 RepID=UPI000CD28136|nr:RraA family protein [Pseudonocardia dioxanivorans]